MPSERQELAKLTRQGITAVDAQFRALAARLSAFTRTFGPLTRETLPRFRAGVRAILAPVFGLTKAAAQTATLFTTITGALEPAFDAPILRVIDRIKGFVTQRDPLLWRRIEGRALTSDDPFSLAVRLFNSPAAQRERLRRALGFDPQRRWVDPKGYRLSDRVWRAGAEVRREIDRTLIAAVREGKDPIQVAKDLDRYLNPSHAPVVYREDGRIVRRNLTNTPRGGWGGTSSRRLARTEISRMHASATIEAAKVTPGVTGVQWLLSNRHVKADECNRNAEADNGLGRGVYTPENFPRLPNHPSCLCVASPVVSQTAVLDAITAAYGGA